MWFTSLLASWKSRHSVSRCPQPRPARRGTPLGLEKLEDRSLPSSYSAATVSALIADITAANAAGGANAISLAAPTTSPYVLTAVNNTTDGNTDLPVIAANDSLTIVGNGDTIESSGRAVRLFAVASGASLTLSNLTLQGGNGVTDGGAIYNQGTLVLNGATVQDNDASIEGGGVYSVGGSLTLEGGAIVQHNQVITSSSAFGGGIFVSGGSATLEGGALVSNNEAISHNGGMDAFGGGLCLEGTTAVLTDVTVDGNSALTIDEPGGRVDGGGLYAFNAVVALKSTTVDGNAAGSLSHPAIYSYGAACASRHVKPP